MAERILHYPKEYLTQVDINLANLKHNFRLIKSFAKDKPIMAVVKGDAYGHGLVECSLALVDEGVQHLGVQDVTEGVALRNSGIKDQKIYVMSGLDYPAQVALAAENDLIVFVYSREQLLNIISLSQVRNFNIKVFLKIDSGMGRLGMPIREASPFIQQAKSSPFITILGITTHLATISDQAAAQQLKTFQDIIRLAQSELEGSLTFSALSGGSLLAHPEYPDGLPRVGLALYGVAPPDNLLQSPVPLDLRTGPHFEKEIKDKDSSKKDSQDNEAITVAHKLKPVMKVISTIIQLKRLKKKETVSYERTYTAQHDMNIAIVPFGYVNGLHTSRNDKNIVLIRGHSAKQIGKICMNLSVFDVTDVPNVRAGDEVVFLGESEGKVIDAYHNYYPVPTNPYEVLCLFGRLNRRVFKRG
jgi:alanine racemase